MEDATRHQLLEIGRRFYEVHAESFDATRRRPWPGWDRVLSHVVGSEPLSVLDVGCGNGRFAEYLASRMTRPARVRYLGVDSSPPLLEVARDTLVEGPFGAVDLRCADAFGLLEPEEATGPFDLIVLFGVLHHLPGAGARRRLLRSLAQRLAPDGVLAITVWRLDRDPQRFQRLRIPWETWNEQAPAALRIDREALEPGDALLGWRGETETPRYVHFPGDAEIEAMERSVTDRPGVTRIDRFHSDGPGSDPPERGDNLYLVFRRAGDGSRAAC